MTPTLSVPLDIDMANTLLKYDFKDCLLIFVENDELTSGHPFKWQVSGQVNNGTIYNGNTGYWKMMYDGPINVKWFDAISDGSADTTVLVQNALNAAISEGKNLFFPSGVYLINGANGILLPGGNQIRGISITGEKSGLDSNGTFLKRTVLGNIIKADLGGGSGAWRGISISNMVLMGENYADGIELIFNQLTKIYDVDFYNLRYSLIVHGDSHFNTFSRLKFVGSFGIIQENIGIYVPLSIGGANENIVENCYWTDISNPIKQLVGGGWSIRNCDIEGENGPSYFSSGNRVSNLRVERNRNGADSLIQIMGDDNVLDLDFYSIGGNLQEYLFTINGKRNKISISGNFLGLVKPYPSSVGSDNEILLKYPIPLLSKTLADSRTVTVKPFVNNGLSNIVPNSENLTSWQIQTNPSEISVSIDTISKLTSNTLLISDDLGYVDEGDILYYSCKVIDTNSGGWHIVILKDTNELLAVTSIGTLVGFYFWSTCIIPSSMSVKIGVYNEGTNGGFLKASNFFVTRNKFSRYVKTSGLPRDISEVDRYYNLF